MDPITGAAIFMSLVGAVTSAEANLKRAKYDKEISEGNALTAESAAADAIARSGISGTNARGRGSQIIGHQKAAYAAGNASVGSGSAVQAEAQTRYFSDMDEIIIRNNAAREAMGYRIKANLFRTEGTLAAEGATNDAAANLIGGFGQVAGIAGRWAVDQPSNKFDPNNPGTYGTAGGP